MVTKAVEIHCLDLKRGLEGAGRRYCRQEKAHPLPLRGAVVRVSLGKPSFG